ncbi:MAG: hypothetical protein HY913_10660 [Desulfomonile tiedjei]|nr:hypothetical protein [Desulfomonile tiedjei]
MALTEEYLKPAASRLSRLQWVLAGLILGFFLGFVDTLLIAAVLGSVGAKVPAYFGVPTTFIGYFFSGVILGRFAPRNILWEPPIGVLGCVWLFMLGFVGLSGHGVLLFLFYFAVVPSIAVGASYLGMRVGRKDLPRWRTRAKESDGHDKPKQEGL